MEKGKVFVVSLAHSIERRAHIQKIFAAAGVDFEFLDAVYGRELDLPNDSRINYEVVSQYPDWLTPNMLGCNLSHIKAYQTIVDQGLDYGFIFEDDVVLEADIQPLMAQVAAKASGNSAILLYYQCWDAITLSQQKGVSMVGDYKQYDVTNQYRFISTAGYCITRDACQTMLQKTLPLHAGPDSWKYFCECGALQQLHMVYPMPVQTFEFQSTISNVLEMKNASLLGKLIAMVEKYKIPLLYWYLQRRRKANKQDLQKITLIP